MAARYFYNIHEWLNRLVKLFNCRINWQGEYTMVWFHKKIQFYGTAMLLMLAVCWGQAGEGLSQSDIDAVFD